MSAYRDVRMLVVGFLVGLLVATTQPAGAVGSRATAPPLPRPDLAAQFTAQINGARAANGRARLTVDGALVSVARSWAATMASRNRLAHNPGLAHAIRGWQYLGENVGVGYSVASLEGAFWGSPEHRANLLDRDFTRIGVAVSDVGGKLWVVEDFSRPAGARAAATATRQPTQHSPRSPSARRPTPPALASSHRPTRSSGRRRPAARPTAEAVQVARLFRARHHPRCGPDWSLLRVHRPAPAGPRA